MSRRLLAVGMCIALIFSATPAMGSKLSATRAQMESLRQQVSKLDTKAEIAAEDYDAASQKYQALHAKQVAMQIHLNKLGHRVGKLQTALNTRVNDMYRSGPLGVIEVLLGAASFEDFASTWDQLNQLNKRDANSVAPLRIARAEIKVTKRALDSTTRQAKAVNDRMAERKRSIQSDLAQRKQLLKGKEKEYNKLYAAYLAAQQASYGGGGNYGDPGTLPHTQVVDIARSKLGCPYRWGAAGPSAFDCSGLAMWVYAQVGIHLPHHAASQIDCGVRVDRAKLQPGDLVFFGSPIHHVGIYVGSGLMIHAPHTGDVVRVAPLQSDYAGACRP